MREPPSVRGLYHRPRGRYFSLYRNRDRRNTTVRACPGTLEAEGHRGGSPPGAGKPPLRAVRPNRDPGNRAALRAGDVPGNSRGAGTAPRTLPTPQDTGPKRAAKTLGETEPDRGRTPNRTANRAAGSLQRSGLHLKYNRRTLTCQGVGENIFLAGFYVEIRV